MNETEREPNWLKDIEVRFPETGEPLVPFPNECQIKLATKGFKPEKNETQNEE